MLYVTKLILTNDESLTILTKCVAQTHNCCSCLGFGTKFQTSCRLLSSQLVIVVNLVEVKNIFKLKERKDASYRSGWRFITPCE